ARDVRAACRLFDGTVELLDRLHVSGTRQAVLSAARESDLLSLLDHFAIRHYFEHVCGLPDVYAATKIERGRELIRMWGVEPARGADRGGSTLHRPAAAIRWTARLEPRSRRSYNRPSCSY